MDAGAIIQLTCTFIVIGCGASIMVTATVWIARKVFHQDAEQPRPYVNSTPLPRRSRRHVGDSKEEARSYGCPACGQSLAPSKVTSQADGPLASFKCDCGKEFELKL